jgi:ABC-2 type transport system ATP-binding protein
MEEADQLCDRLAIMDHGKLLALDTPASLKKSVGADTDVKLTTSGDAEGLAKHLESLDGVTRVRLVEDVIHAYFKGASGVIPRLVEFADDGGFPLIDLSVTEPTLETVFIELTGKDLRD